MTYNCVQWDVKPYSINQSTILYYYWFMLAVPMYENSSTAICVFVLVYGYFVQIYLTFLWSFWCSKADTTH